MPNKGQQAALLIRRLLHHPEQAPEVLGELRRLYPRVVFHWDERGLSVLSAKDVVMGKAINFGASVRAVVRPDGFEIVKDREGDLLGSVDLEPRIRWFQRCTGLYEDGIPGQAYFHKLAEICASPKAGTSAPPTAWERLTGKDPFED